MSGFDRAGWDERWALALETHGDRLAERPPNAHLVAEAAGLPPGRALDAGCGHGAETLWLAARGWHVTAVDFAAAALGHGRSTAEAIGPDVAGRVEGLEADLGTWAPPPGEYDLVACLYVHVAGSVEELVRRLGTGVAKGGTLLLVGHHPAPGQVQVSVEEARATLDPECWELLVAEERPRTGGGGVDAVVKATRR